MSRAVELVLPPEASSARTARRWVRSRLAELHLEPLTDAVELLTSETVTNSLLHAGTEMVLRMEPSDSGVQVEVRDGSPVPPLRRRYSSTATTGRGVAVLDDLADEWGWTAEPSGKTVWFRVLRPRDVWAVFDIEGLMSVEPS